jgi:methylmalonyl-CoA mutase
MVELARSTEEEKRGQLTRLKTFQDAHHDACNAVLQRLRQTVIDNGNTFEVLMEAVRHASLGQITQTLFEVGGRYRRNM